MDRLEKKLRIAQAGLGGFGLHWLDVLSQAEDIELVAIVDGSAEARARAVEKVGPVPAFASMAEAVSAVAAQAALIVVPPALHEEVALAALDAGWHVLCEKPLAEDLPAAARLLAATERAGRVFMVSQNYRWSAPIATLRHHLQSGLIGEMGAIRYTFNKAWDFGGWRATLPDVLLEDMTIHHVDLLRYLVGRDCAEVFASSYRPAWSWFSGNSAAAVLLRFEGGPHVAYYGSWVGAGPQTTWTGAIEIDGATGMLVLRDDQLTHYPRARPNGGVAEPRSLELLTPPLTGQEASLARFVAAVREGTTPETGIHDNIQSFAIVCAALVSARDNRPVSPATLLKEATE